VSAAEVGVPSTLRKLDGINLRLAAGAEGSPVPASLSDTPRPVNAIFYVENSTILDFLRGLRGRRRRLEELEELRREQLKKLWLPSWLSETWRMMVEKGRIVIMTEGMADYFKEYTVEDDIELELKQVLKDGAVIVRSDEGEWVDLVFSVS
jgi:hypothetical protein